MKPKCYYCDEKPAKVLSRAFDAMFCSQRCAAWFGMELASCNDMHWCAECKDWVDDAPGGCPHNEEEE